MEETLKTRIGVDFSKYKILGDCIHVLAHKALRTEDKIGVFLPCNVVVQEHDEGRIEVLAVDPVVSTVPVGNKDLECIAIDVQEKLQRVIEG